MNPIAYMAASRGAWSTVYEYVCYRSMLYESTMHELDSSKYCLDWYYLEITTNYDTMHKPVCCNAQSSGCLYVYILLNCENLN